MEMENIIKFIQTVSDSALSSFKYVEGDSSLTLEINRNIVYSEAPEIKTSPVYVDANVVNENTKTNSLTITSPMVGTFYQASNPGAAPFVKPGQNVTKGTTIAIIEAMKIMNEIEAEFDCRILKNLVSDGSPVEFGMPLFEVEKL